MLRFACWGCFDPSASLFWRISAPSWSFACSDQSLCAGFKSVLQVFNSVEFKHVPAEEEGLSASAIEKLSKLKVFQHLRERHRSPQHKVLH